ncbi:MgtC/SapB family protein [Streptomyces sp. NPDC059740]|uniref:MgtC/SapB family protein n=1 Tax=Streptomyces sp. NPDC059740 TaxID=3346926 RepID=UPI0036677AF6
MVHFAWGEPSGQGWTQIGYLGIAFLLSAAIGLERELKQRAAGVRTYTVVGLGSALFLLVSKYGFTDVLVSDHVVLDPSRVAAQIVSGLGFIGGGVIFVKRDAVRGLTTAASVWLTAGVGAAAAAGLPVLAVVGTVAYFLAVLFLPVVARASARLLGTGYPRMRIQYLEGQGLLRELLSAITEAGFSVVHLETTDVERAEATTSRRLRKESETHAGGSGASGAGVAEVSVSLDGKGDLDGLVNTLAGIEGVLTVNGGASADE